jgi:hypothetical protein
LVSGCYFFNNSALSISPQQSGVPIGGAANAQTVVVTDSVFEYNYVSCASASSADGGTPCFFRRCFLFPSD